MSLAKNIQDVLVTQDVELANAITDLRGNPAKLADFMASRKADVYGTVTREHSDNFEKVYGDLQRSSDTVKNILYYHTRNKDLNSLQQQIFDRTKAEADNATFDSQVAKRQFEVNEWTFGNKQDTLFFFQLMFIGLTLIAPLLYLQKTGLLPTTVFYGVSGIVVFALVLTVVVRAQYTEQTRDQTFWNRRRFKMMGGPPTAPTCEAIQAYASKGLSSLQNVASQAEAGLEGAVGQVQGAAMDVGGRFNKLAGGLV
jgi:hypothetical protein